MNVFEEIKETIVSMAKLRGVDDSEIVDKWSIDYSGDADERFIKSMLALSELMRVCRNAEKKGDLMTARCALVEAQGFAHNLSSFFFAIKEDIQRISDGDLNRTSNPALDWPELPERYEYPIDYGYRDPERSVELGGKTYRWIKSAKRWVEVAESD